VSDALDAIMSSWPEWENTELFRQCGFTGCTSAAERLGGFFHAVQIGGAEFVEECLEAS
jgi:hypothetical protein